MNRRHDDPASAGIVFAIGVLVGALLTCVGIAIAIPELMI